MSDNQELVTGITGPAQALDTPQFSTAEYGHIPGTERCRICGNAIAGEYFRVNNQMACGKCAGEARAGQPSDSHAAFARGLLLGAGAALVGLILYATFTIVTGFYVGYIALGVGWLVAKAITKGSNGMGGRRYQIAAVLLTYAAISMAAVPISIAAAAKAKGVETNQIQSSGQADSATIDQDTNGQAQGPKQEHKLAFGAAMLYLALVGIASPFLELQDPIHGVIGLVILFIGLRIAFRLTAARQLEVDGPYNVTS